MIVMLEVVEAEDLGLDAQALAEIARADADRIALLHDAEDLGGVLGIEAGLVGEVLDGEVRGARRRPARSMPLRSRKPFSSRLPRTSSAKRRSVSVKSLIWSCQREVVDEVRRLGEVLLDGRQLLEAAAARGERLLERAVLEELLPVDLADLLVVGLLGLAGLDALPVLEAVDPELALLVRLVDGVDGVVLGGAGAGARSRRRRGPGSRRAPYGFRR